MKKHLFFLIYCLLSGTAACQVIEADGFAALDQGDMEFVRKSAIKDALRQAEISSSAQIEASSTLSGNAPGGLRENISVKPNARTSSYSVINEHENDGLLNVRVQANVTETPISCNGSKNNRYRKKVTATAFRIVNPIQVEDINDPWNGYPLEILRRLEARRVIVPSNSPRSLLSGGQDPNPDSPSNRDIIRRIAELSGSQFVISGIILDAGFSKETVRPYAGWQGNEQGRRFELGFLWNSVAAGIKPDPNERRLEVEIYLHDGLTGALIARHRDHAIAAGKVVIGRDKPFSSAGFFETDFGRAIGQMLAQQVENIAGDLACLPFMATIVRIDGNRIYIDAGVTSGLSPGDKLTIYRQNPLAPVQRLASQVDLGIPETPVGTLTLQQVQPLFSVGNPGKDLTTANIQVGDLVRFETSQTQ